MLVLIHHHDLVPHYTNTCW